MLKFRTTRLWLGLYGTLLVVPTLVFGGLYWRELQKDYQAQLDAVPESAQDSARRITAGMGDRLDKLIDDENRRDFFQYAELFAARDAVETGITLQKSPLVSERPPQGLLAWFAFDRFEGAGDEIDDGIDLYASSNPKLGTAEREELLEVIREFRRQKTSMGLLRRVPELGRALKHKEVPLAVVAINRRQRERDPEVLDCLRDCAAHMEGLMVNVKSSDFHLTFYVDRNEKPRALATRRVFWDDGLERLPDEALCLEPLRRDFGLYQGFVIDVDWLFKQLPRVIAEQALSEAEELRVAPKTLPMETVGSVFAEIHPVLDLGFETLAPDDEYYGKLEVAINTDRIEQRFNNQSNRFLGVALMLVLTLGTGMTLLYRSVRRELDHAHRMQNFVAAVTHELRTPISTIRLHGEMLMDGWAADDTKRKEYYRRIVRETGRLSTLVERVLEKSRLKESVTVPEPTDLSDRVATVCQDLFEGDDQDLELQLDEGLPPVWSTADAVPGILSNLVENARKYAPVGPGDEPIRISTARQEDRIILEVADRGPGVPSSEVERVFEAFYRVGSEETRTTTGTGLGLHLVRLHAESSGALASVHAREGGGSVFQIAFQPADSA